MTEKTAEIYGEPPPRPGQGDMWQQVIARYENLGSPRDYADACSQGVLGLFRARREMGISKYGTPLQACNGRNPLQDLLDETLDRIVYAEQAIAERPERERWLRRVQHSDVEFVQVIIDELREVSRG